MKRIIVLLSTALVGLPIVASAAVDGHLCFESKAEEPGSPTVYTDYTITFQKGEVATVAGQLCYVNPGVQRNESMAITGHAQFHNGLMEIDTTGSDKVNLSGVGDVFSFMHGYTQIDSETLVGSGESVVTYVINGVPQTVVSTYSGSNAMPCPKLTQEDKDSIKLRKKC